MNRDAISKARACAVALAHGRRGHSCGLGAAFWLEFGKSPRLLPTLHATEVLDCAEVADGREYDYTARGYFKIRGKTVAPLLRIAGHADATRQRLVLTVKRPTRRTIRAAARRAGAQRVTLTLVYRLQRTAGAGSWSGKAYGADSFLRIPREASRTPAFTG